MRGTSFRSWFIIIALLLLLMPIQVYGQSDQVKIGVLASRGADDALKTWQPTAEYLTKEIPQDSFVIVPLDIDEIAPAVERKDVDFVITNPSNYVELEASYGATRIATMKSIYGGHYYKVFGSVIFRRLDRDDIKDLNDLKGKSFMAVQETIFSWQMAWNEIKDKGIEPHRDFKKLEFSGLPQDLVVYAVRDGKADAGTVRTGILESMASEGKINLSDFIILNPQHDDFPLLHSTGLYPEWALTKAKYTSDELAEKVVAALLTMPLDGAAVKAANAAWTVPLDYQPVHKLMIDLRIGPYKDFGKITAIDVIIMYWYWIIIAFAMVLFVRSIEADRANKNLRQDLTERKKAEESLKESEEKYRKLIETANDAIFIADAETGVILEANKKAGELLGMPIEKIIGMHQSQLHPKEEADHYRKIFLEKFQNGKEISEDIFIIHKDGHKIPVEISSSITELKGKRIAQGIFRDITERKYVDKLRFENERLVYANKAKNDFLSNMSHELRTPLNAVIGFSELLKMNTIGNLNEKQEGYVDNIRYGGKHLLNIISDILDLSKLDAGKMELVIENISVPETLNQTIVMVKETAKKNTVTLKKELAPELEFIEADKQRLIQIIFNLMSNAIKFNKKGGTVTVTTQREGDMAKFSVSDTGIGIKEEDKCKLFTNFEQLDSGISKKYGGTGLGLAITKKLVELHGGNIWIDSEFGAGSTFNFTLPIKAKKEGNK